MSDAPAAAPLKTPAPKPAGPDGRPRSVVRRLRAATLAILAVTAAAAVVAVPSVGRAFALHEADGRVVELSGRQRMLSQRVAKIALAIGAADSEAARDSWRGEMRSTLDEWNEGLDALRFGSDELGVSGQNSPDVRRQFEAMEPHYEAIRAAGGLLAEGRGGEEAAAAVMRHEQPFLRAMHGITTTYAAEADARAREFSAWCGWLAVALVGLPLLTVALVSEPALRAFRESQWLHQVKDHRHDRDRQLVENYGQMSAEVAQRRRTEDRLRESLEELQIVSEAADRLGCPALRLDDAGRVRWANAAFADVTGHESGAAAGLDARSLLAGETADRSDLRAVREAVAGGRAARRELLLRRAGGEEFWAVVDVEPCGSPDGRGLVMTLTETTDRRRRVEELESDLAAARSKVDAQGRFLAHVSHEIRTPLSAVLGYADLMASGEMDADELAEGMRNVRDSGRMLLSVVDGVLDYSKLDAAQPPSPEPTDVAGLLRGLADSFGGLAQGKGLRLTVEAGPDVPAAAMLDPDRTRQVVSNLLGNAIKFTHSGGVTLKAEAAAGGLRLSVIDTGVGIAADRQAAVFEPFEQAGDHPGGTGLGLAISRSLARQMGGDIALDSTPGVGTRFDVTLPLEAAEPPPAAPASPPGESSMLVGSTLAGVRVLLCDDWEVNREMIRLVLERSGAEVCTAADGRQAVDAAITWEPDVILMDMMMPVMTGREAIAELQRQGCGVPVIALTAEALRGDRERCLNLGCVDYVAKPVDFKALKRAVRGAARAAAADAPAARLQDLTAARAMFFDERDQTLARMDEALSANDLSTVASLAHGLRGAAAMVGLSHWAGPLERAERAAVDGDVLAVVHAVQTVRDAEPAAV